MARLRAVSLREVPFDQRLEGRKQAAQANALGKGYSGQRNSKSEGPEAVTGQPSGRASHCGQSVGASVSMADEAREAGPGACRTSQVTRKGL